jgi:ubiquinone/menaquinone biosynthesis C-methylase UbiE
MFVKRQDPHHLAVGMTGVKLGDNLAQIGCVDGGRMAAVAGKVGLSGRAVVVVPDNESAARARKAAANAGVLVEVEIGPPTRLPLEDAGADLVIVDDTAGVIGSLRTEDRSAAIRELLRVVRPGGRVMIIGTAPRAGLSALLQRGPAGPPFALSGDANQALQNEGFKMVRTLAEHEGLVFVEAVKPRQP